MALQVRKYQFKAANQTELRKRIDPTLLVTTPGRLYVDVTWDDINATAADVDAEMDMFGFEPAPVGAIDAFLELESPDTSRWDFQISNEGAVKVSKEGTAIVKPVSLVAQSTVLAVDVSTVSPLYSTLLSLGPFTTGGGPLLIHATAGVTPLVSSGVANLRILLDGVMVDARQINFFALGATQPLALSAITPAAPGLHTVTLEWRIIGVLAELHCRPATHPDDESARLSVIELAA